MFSSIFTKTLYEKRWSLLGWAIGLLAMTIMTMIFYPNFKHAEFEAMFKSMPESLKPLVGSAESFKTIPGYIAQQVYGPQIPVFLIIMGIMLFIGIGIGDEDRGTLQTLLVQPVSRSKVYWQKALAGAALIMLATLTIAAGVLISLVFINETYSLSRLIAVTLSTFLMVMAFSSVAYGIGLGFGKKGLSIGVASGYAFFSFIITSLAPAVEKLRPAEKFSVFYYFNSPNFAVAATNWAHVLVLVGFSAVFLIGGLILFRHRDLQ